MMMSTTAVAIIAVNQTRDYACITYCAYIRL